MAECNKCLCYEVCKHKDQKVNIGSRIQDLIHECIFFKERARYVDRGNGPLTVDELKELPLRAWVWIEVLVLQRGSAEESAYYRKCIGYDPVEVFECGYPGWSTCYDYKDYGKTWLAYRAEPREGLL